MIDTINNIKQKMSCIYCYFAKRKKLLKNNLTLTTIFKFPYNQYDCINVLIKRIGKRVSQRVITFLQRTKLFLQSRNADFHEN